MENTVLKCESFFDCLISTSLDVLMVNHNFDSWNLFLSGHEKQSYFPSVTCYLFDA